MASVLEDVSCVEHQIEASGTKTWSCSNSLEGLKNLIQEASEEQMLVELARIEASRDLYTIHAQREKELNEYYYQMEKQQKKMTEIVNEIYHTKNIQIKLANTMSDMNMLQNELNLLKEMDNRRSCFRQEEELALQSVNGELNIAKEELASIKKEMFSSKGAMGILRTELRDAMEEMSRLRKSERTTELTIRNLNSQLLHSTSRFKAACEGEKMAREIDSNLALSLKKLKTECEAAKKENFLIIEEITSTKSVNQNTESEMDLNEENLQATMQELETVMSSEIIALEKLRLLTDNMEKSRASSSLIHVSNFEHAYLTGNAVYAEEVAYKKVAAAEAWINALKASEKEIAIRTELASIEASELIRLEEEKNLPSNHETSITGTQNMQDNFVLPRKSVTKNGSFMQARRTGFQLSKSLPTRHMCTSDSIKLRKSKNVISTMSNFFSNKSVVKS